MEAANVLKPKLGAEEVVVAISGDEGTSEMKKESTVLESPVPSSPGISRLRPLPTQAPKPTSENGLRQRPIRRPLCLKPKSRLMETPYPLKAKLVEEVSGQNQTATASSPDRNGSSATMNSPYNGGGRGAAGKESTRAKTHGSVTSKNPLMASAGGEDGEDDDVDDGEIYKTAGHFQDEVEVKKHGKNVKFLILIEWIAFFTILGILIASLCIDKLKNCYLWGLNVWKWCLLVLVIFCGHLITQWLMDVLVFFIERNFLLHKKVLYFVHGLRRSVRVFVWLGLILLTWVLLIKRGVKRSRRTTRVLNYITRAIASTLIGASLWMVKTLLVKVLASSFHVNAYFDRIQESIFHQYVLQVLSGPPLLKYTDNSTSYGKLSFQQPKKSGKRRGSEEEVIDVDKLFKMKKEKISAWTMGGLVKVIRGSGSLTISELLDESQDNEGVRQKEIRSEIEARAAAKQIFKKVAKTGNEYIEEEDLSLYMPREHVDYVLLMFEGAAETGKIKKSDFKRWVVQAYQERKYLAHSLDDSKTAIEELNRMASVITLVIIIIMWLLLMEIAKTRVLVFIASQILLAGFMFGNSAKTLFEAIVFVFVTHPFDVGDKCVIDGVQMLVEEMNILNTIFLKSDNEKMYYPNALLAAKPISNFNRSPEMGDTVEFAVDFSTTVESIAALKARIKEYLESKPLHWRPSHSVQILAIEDMNKLKMTLCVTHTVNYQSPERANRRSELVLELKRIFEDLDVKYHLIPQEVHLRYVGSETQSSTATTTR